jgi:hypothetical protein
VQPLDESRRRRLWRLSALLCLLSAALAPIAGRSSLELRSDRESNVHFDPVRLPSRRNPTSIVLLRDPFAGAPRAVTGANGERGPTAIEVRGVIADEHASRAIVDERGQVRLIEAGDLLGAERVTLIDKRGVHLDDGTLVPLAAGEVP